MNTINFNKNDFPLTTNVLNFLQAGTVLLENICKIFGPYVIVSGCITNGSVVSSGYVIVNGELMHFDGGTLQTNVIVSSTSTTITVQAGNYTKTEKKLMFGTGVGQIAWNLFKKCTTNVIDDLISLKTQLDTAILDYNAKITETNQDIAELIIAINQLSTDFDAQIQSLITELGTKASKNYVDTELQSKTDSVQVSQIVGNILDIELDRGQPMSPTYATCWGDYLSGLKIYKNDYATYKKVELTGWVKVLDVQGQTPGILIFTLPVNYRPLEDIQFPVSSDGTLYSVYIDHTNGQVMVIGASALPVGFKLYFNEYFYV